MDETTENKRDLALPPSERIKDEATLFASPLPIVGERKTTTRKEIWSWYFYYVGNSGLEPALSGRMGSCVCAWHRALWGRSERSVNSIVLITNGLSFAFQAVLFLIVGSFADYGVWRPHITTAFTVLTWAVSFAWLGVETPWQAGTALYILGLIGYQGALTFWTAAFPGLARDLPEVKESEEKLARGETTQKAHDTLDMLQRNRLANVSFLVCSLGEIVVLAILAGILEGVITDDPNSNTRALSIVCAYSAGVWTTPKDQLLYRRAAYFFLGDCLNTVVIATLQNEVVSYDTKFLNYIGLFWLVQKKYTIPTKTMLLFTKFGFHNSWEFWAYQAFYGIFQAMISEVVPRGKEFLFFAFFSIIGKTSSFIGPFVSSAIIDRSGNTNMPFTFLLGLGAVSVGILACVNVEKSRIECRKYLEDEAVRVYGMDSSELLVVGSQSDMDGERVVPVSDK
ncbi:hypothetical protein IAU60_005414 [Kwoniella sp. DSM 27419]